MKKSDSTKIYITTSESAKEEYYKILNDNNLTHNNLLEYFLAIHKTQPTKGLDLAERRVQQFLHLGTNGEEITIAMIRGVDAMSVKKAEKQGIELKPLNGNTCKEMYKKYIKEIEAYNNNLKS